MGDMLMTAIWTPSRDIFIPKVRRKASEWVKMATGILTGTTGRKTGTTGIYTYGSGGCGCCGPVTCTGIYSFSFSGMKTSCVSVGTLFFNRQLSSFDVLWNIPNQTIYECPSRPLVGTSCSTSSGFSQPEYSCTIGASSANIDITFGPSTVFTTTVPISSGEPLAGIYDDTSGVLGGTVTVSSGTWSPIQTTLTSVSISATTCGYSNIYGSGSYTLEPTLTLSAQVSNCENNPSVVSGYVFDNATIAIYYGTVLYDGDAVAMPGYYMTVNGGACAWYSNTLTGTYTSLTSDVNPQTITVT